MNGETLRDYATDAIRYWEPRRIAYNVLLVVVVAIYFFGFGMRPHAFSVDSALLLVLLAVLANVAYCAAYVVDIFAQMSGFREQWRNLRWVLFAIGAVFAAILARFWSIGLFGNS